MIEKAPMWVPADYERAYLTTDDACAQAGFRGTSARWKAARGAIAHAIDGPGTLLDVGCANGLLMESLASWSPHAIEPYGIDFGLRDPFGNHIRVAQMFAAPQTES